MWDPTSFKRPQEELLELLSLGLVDDGRIALDGVPDVQCQGGQGPPMEPAAKDTDGQSISDSAARQHG